MDVGRQTSTIATLDEVTTEESRFLHSDIGRTLRYLRNPPSYVVQAHEIFQETDECVTRTVELVLQLPSRPAIGAPPFSANDFLYFVALTPAKRRDVDVELSSAEGEISHKRLSDSDTLIFSKRLIRYRARALFSTVRQKGHRRLEEDALFASVFELENLPNLNTSDARKLVQTSFAPSKKLQVLQDAKVDFDQSIRFYSLCKLLAERKLVIFKIPIPRGATDLHFRYRYVRPSRQVYNGTRGWIRHSLSGVPFEQVFHAPMAHASQEYTASIDAPTGYYFDGQLMFGQDIIGPSSRPNADLQMWILKRGDRPPPGFYPINRVSEDVDESGYDVRSANLKTSKIFVASGYKIPPRLFLYYRLNEKPPGTVLRPVIAVTILWIVFCLILVQLFLGHGDDSRFTGPITSGVFAILGTLAYAIPESVKRPAVTPRLLFCANICLSVAFAIWLIFEPNRPPARHSHGNYEWGRMLANLWPGLVMFALTSASLIYLLRRMRATSRRYRFVREALEESHNES